MADLDAAGPVLRALVDQLVAARHDRGLTQQDVAAELSVSRQLVSQWERQGRDCRVSTLVRWGAVVGLKVTLVRVEVAAPGLDRMPAAGQVLRRRDDGAPVRVDPNYPVLVYGPARLDVVQALVMQYQGGPVIHNAGDHGQVHLAELLARHGQGRGRSRTFPASAVLVLDVEDVEQYEEPLLGDLLTARPCALVLHARNYPAVPPIAKKLVRNTLYASSRKLVRANVGGRTATWHIWVNA